MAWRPIGDPQSHPLPPLLPPEPVDKPSKQQAYLKRVLSESRSVLDSDPATAAEGWQLVERRKGFSVYKRPVEQGKKLTMSRLEVEVPLPPDQLFELLAHTQDGRCIVDPFPREHHGEFVQALRMPLAGDAKVVYSEAPRFWGLLRPREYVTCGAAATKERLFVCKSCEVPEGPLAAP